MRTIAGWTALVGTMMLSMLASAHAEETVKQANTPQPEATRQWLELQRSGQAASPQRQTLSGEAMSKIHERYIKSFTHPIPASYEHAQGSNK
jgi:hypothetical protein